MIVKTDAIVLSAMKYRDTSKIVRLYTREFGKLSVIAKGARDSKSKFRSALEPMSFVSCVIYKNENREMQLLSQCDVVRPLRYLSEDLEKMSVAMTAIELVDVVTHAEEQNASFFSLILDLLETVNTATKNAVVALYWFELRLAELLGFRPELHDCSYCRKNVEREIAEGKKFSMAGTGILCAACSEDYDAMERISSGTLRVLQRLQDAEISASLMNLHLTLVSKDELRRTLRGHLQKHIDGFRGLKSEKVFAAVL